MPDVARNGRWITVKGRRPTARDNRANTMKRLFLFGVVGLALTGCAVPTTGVVPRGDDMYTVTRQGAAAWITVDSLKTAALQEADAYCSGKSKKMKFVYNKDIPAGVLGRWPESEVLFKCE